MNAIEKINAEMQKDPQNRQLEIVGHYLIDRASLDPKTAERIMIEDKSLSGAWKAVMDAAKKQSKHGCACMCHTEVFGIIDEYFGLEEDEAAQEMAMFGRIVTKHVQKKPDTGVVVNLADFL